MSGLHGHLAIARWAWRSFRREWKQQALVVALLGVAVATGIGFQALLFNTTGVREQATFGTANHRYEVGAADPEAVTEAARLARARFGPIDVVGRWTAPLPGSVDTVDHVAQEPAGPHSGPMLALVDGRYPVDGDEAALTDGLVSTLGLDIGSTVDLDGTARTVVGVVENPSDLERDFVLTAPTELAHATSFALLVGGSGGFDEVTAIRAFGGDHLPDAELTSKGDRANGRAAAGVLAGTQVVLLLVGLVASAGFAAVAQRRLRQLGLLGAVGASQRQVTLVVLANGAAVGVVAATAGAAVGLAAWLVAAPALEEPVGYRIDAANLPYPLLALTLATTIAAASAAAWLPARAAARVPIVRALARHPAPQSSAAPSAVLGLGVTAAGVATLAVGARSQPVVLVVGTLATVAGVLLLAPAATAALGRVAASFPVAVRIALRDLARHRSRSALALAAVSLALGIPVAVVVLARSAEAAADVPNLPPGAAVLWTKDASQPDGVSPFYTVDTSDEGFAPYLPDLAPGELDRLGAVARAAAADLDADVVPLEVVVDPAVRDDPLGRRAVTLARRTDIGYLDVALLYAASPPLLEPYGEPVGAGLSTTAPPGPAQIVTDREGLWLANAAGPPEAIGEHRVLDARHGSLPGSFLAPAAIADRGWTTATVGWLVRADRPLLPRDLSRLRDLAAAEGLVVEGPEAPRDLTSLRWGATLVGMLVALAVLAMTVGLVRVEGAADLPLLLASGATTRIQRALTAATAGSLAAAGAAIGTLGAYVALAAGHLRDLDALVPVPVGELGVILLAVPAVAVGAGWVVSGRDPRMLTRALD